MRIGPRSLADVVSRYARTHGPFSSSDCAHALGLPVAVVTMTLRRLVSQSAITEGTFSADVTGSQWCDAGVLRQIRRRTLAKLRSEVEPVSTTALARFLPVWHKVGPLARSGMPALVAAIEQIQAVPIAASALEQLVLPARVSDYQPWMLDELCTSGEVIWVGSGSLTGNDGLVRLVFSDSMELLTETAEAPAVIDPIEHQILKVLAPGQALFFRSLSDQMNQLNRVDLASQTSPIKETDLIAALWSLIWQGHIVGDSFAPIRALLSSGRSASSRGRSGATARPRLRYRSYSLSASRLAPQSRIPASVGGRWSRLVVPETTPGFAGALQVQALLDRQGIVAHSTIAAEHIPGGFAGLYPTLSTLEEQGQLRRGYFVETLGGAQFSLPEVIDQLRSCQEIPSHPETVLVLAATDPANVYGASVPWPERGTDALARPGRKAGAIVVLVDGKLVLYVERGGRTMMNWGGDERDIHAACAALTSTISAGRVGAIRVEKVNGVPVWDTPVGKALTTAGFTITPQGLQYRPSSGQ